MEQPRRMAPATSRRRTATIALAAGALAFGIAACAPSRVEDSPSVDSGASVATAPEPVDLDALSEESIELLADDIALTEQLAVTLDEWFGDLFEPRYRLLPEWEAAGFDPNTSPFDGARAYEGYDEADLDGLRAGNRRHWLRVFEALDDGTRLPGPWPGRRDLNRAWRDLRRERGALDEAAFREETRAMFEEDYPTRADTVRLFARNCQQCHGMRGGGDGPMSNMMEPRPRDYRHGVFKFCSVNAPARPRREDLRRTLEHGLPGTQMASWEDRLGSGEREALIDRVRWIAIRGEVERWLVASWLSDDERPAEAIEEAYRTIWGRWLTADEYFVALQDEVPPATAESIARGDALFHDETRANCASCHGFRGRGDGPTAVEVRPDGTRTSLIVDEWGRPAWPRDLTTGVFRGGTRPIDVYRRIHCGIHGTPMPGQAGTLTEQEMWDVVHYVRSIAGLE